MLKRMDNVLNVVDDLRDEDAYRLAHIHGARGPLVALAEQLGGGA